MQFNTSQAPVRKCKLSTARGLVASIAIGLTLNLAIGVASSATLARSAVDEALAQTQVQELSSNLAESGFRLGNIKDNYAMNGERPRCLCESLEMTFVSYSHAGSKLVYRTFKVEMWGDATSGTSVKIEEITTP
jgi:hypothetical protein